MDQHAICSACGQHWTTTDVETATAGELGTLVLGALDHLQHSSPPQHKATVMPDTAQHALSIDTDSPGNVK